jgi:Ca2+-binding RTX toxin-like protein
MRRLLLSGAVALVMAAMMVAGSGGTAFAQLMGSAIQCQGIPCVATGDGDVLFERVGDGVPDRMLAQGNHDLLRAQNYTNDRDVAKGGFGNDRLLVNDGDAMDGAIGGAGNDVCVVDAAVEASYTCERVIYR